MEFQVSVADVRDRANPAEIDCVIAAGPQHLVGDLADALRPLFPLAGGSGAAGGSAPANGGPGAGGTGRWAGPGGASPGGGAGGKAGGNAAGGAATAGTGSWGGWGSRPVNGANGAGGTAPDGSSGWGGWGAGRAPGRGSATAAASTVASGGTGASVTTGTPGWSGTPGSTGTPGTSTPGWTGAPGQAAAGVGDARLWLDGQALDASTTLAASGIRAGARLGLGGPAPGAGQPGPGRGGPGALWWGTPEAGAAGSVSLRPDPGDPFVLIVNKQMRAAPSMPAPVVVNGALPAGEAERQPTPWLNLLLGPAISIGSSVAMAVFIHQWAFLLLGLGGAVATLLPQLLSLRKGKKQARRRAQMVTEAAATLRRRIGTAVAAEEALLRDALPGPAAVIETAIGTGPRLWERSAGDEDFLRVRLGTTDRPARTVIVQGADSAPGQASDPWAALAGTPGLAAADFAARDGAAAGGAGSATIDETPVVRDVPVTADLGGLGVLGVAGPPSAGRETLAWMAAQLAAAHGPGELRLLLLTDSPQAWRWTGWLPHLRPLGDPDGWLAVGTDAASKARRVAELRELVAQRQAAASGAGPAFGGLSGLSGLGGGGLAGSPGGGAPADQSPAVVMIIDGYAGVRDIDGIDEVLTGGPGVGVYAICRDGHRRELPAACGALLERDAKSGESGSYWERGKPGPERVTRLDQLGNWRDDEFGRALAPLRDRVTERKASGGAAVRLNDLWGYDQVSPAVVEQLWAKRQGSVKVPLGRLADGSVFTLDIARQGPHMLVAGSPGAGKSEFLQTFVASLAVANPPDSLNFVLIDYKGGAAFDGCRPLPHVTGFLTDLDEHLAKRVIASLRAETRYREALLAEARVPDIESYRAAGSPRGPLPRLLLVADEFRFLALEMPEALKELTDVTARGRSLGVHLVLATQRPAGVVNADIQANTSLRLCFRVEDPQDSTAVIDVTDAAAIPKQAKGRGYARTERSAVTAFQGAYVGGPADGKAAAGEAGAATLRVTARPFAKAGTPVLARDTGPLGLGGPPGPGGPRGLAAGPTDLAAIVESVTATRRQAPEHRAWLDPLPPLLPLSALPAGAGAGNALLPPVPYGMTDMPARQRQEPLTLDLENGSHLLIAGAPQSGRTTALRSIAAQLAAGYSPADVHLYVLDCDAGLLAPLERLPHCGAVVRRTEAERAGRLLDRLDAEVARRKDALSAAGFSSVTEQRRASPAAARLPYMVLLLDLWEAFSADLGQTDMQRLSAVLSRLVSEGAAAGLRVVITGGLAALGKLSSAVPARVVLRLASANDSHAAGVPRGALPAGATAGRGVLLPEAHEVQIGFAGRDPSGAAQAAAVEELVDGALRRYPVAAPAPIRVDPMPARISLARASALGGWHEAGPLRPGLGVGGDQLGWHGPDLDRFPGFAIAGPPYSGRSTALVVLATSLLRAGAAVIAVTPRESPLRALDGRDGVLAVFKEANPDQRKLYELLEGAGGPVVVLVDDAEEVVGQPADQLLAQIPKEGRGRGQALVVAGAPADLVRGSRNLAAAARSYNCGLLLAPDDTQMASQLLGLRITRSALFGRPAGRGYLVAPGQSVLIQVPEVTGT